MTSNVAEQEPLSVATFLSGKHPSGQYLSENALFTGSDTAPKSVTGKTLLSRVACLIRAIDTFDTEHWALTCQDTEHFITGLLALVATGKTICLPANCQPGTLGSISEHSRILLTDGSGMGFRGKQLSFNDITSTDSDACGIQPRCQKASLVFYTSGSSGEPKAIVKRLHQLEAEINAQEQLWGQQLQNACFMACVAHQHIYGVLFRILWPLLAGRSVDCKQYDYPEQLLAQIRQHSRVALIASPAQLERLPEELNWVDGREHLAAVFSSGAPLPAKAATKTQQLLNQLPIEVLGSTETGGVAWRQQHAEKINGWKPIPGVTISLDGKQLQVFSPWLDDPDAGFVMGDTAELLENNCFLLKGRADLIVKIEGKRLSLNEMSSHLENSILVDQAKVVVLEGQRNQIGAVIVLTTEGTSLLNNSGRLTLSRKLRQGLALYFDNVTLPRKWRYLNTMPVNAQGKLVQSELVQLFTDKPLYSGATSANKGKEVIAGQDNV